MAFYHGTHGNALRATQKEFGKDRVFMHFVHDFPIYLFTGVYFELFRIIILILLTGFRADLFRREVAYSNQRLANQRLDDLVCR